jgi:hypothetical protein
LGECAETGDMQQRACSSDSTINFNASRVEERRGFPVRSRFPSPLIERSVRISRTTLSD